MRCVILDDYQQVALSYAAWSRLEGVETTSVPVHLADDDSVVAALDDADIVVVMRERTPVTAALLDRLPRLRLVVTSGMRNASIDLAAAAERGSAVCGTASSSTPPVELTWALILGLARHLVPEVDGMQRDGPWQSAQWARISPERRWGCSASARSAPRSQRWGSPSAWRWSPGART